MKKIRTLIVDDEALARAGIETMLSADPEVEVIGQCADGQSALMAIRGQKPDLVFLDVQMPKRDGFEVLAELKAPERPRVIFVTAYDQYALRAFDYYAVDYLLKPFQDARFLSALARAKHEIRQAATDELGQRVDQLLAGLASLTSRREPAAPPARAAADRAEPLVVKAGGDLHFLKKPEIVWLESQGDFVKVHTTGAARLVRDTLQDLLLKWNAPDFIRIHRSHVVNVAHVRQVTPSLYGDHTVLLSDGSKLRLSRSYKAQLKALIAGRPAS
jgi:two-component system LytT family response regulator